MEELKNKTFLIKIRSELFDFLKTQNKHEKVGKLKIFLNKKETNLNLFSISTKMKSQKTSL